MIGRTFEFVKIDMEKIAFGKLAEQVLRNVRWGVPSGRLLHTA